MKLQDDHEERRIGFELEYIRAEEVASVDFAKIRTLAATGRNISQTLDRVTNPINMEVVTHTIYQSWSAIGYDVQRFHQLLQWQLQVVLFRLPAMKSKFILA